jgi:hypothetical protein
MYVDTPSANTFLSTVACIYMAPPHVRVSELAQGVPTVFYDTGSA